MSKERSADERAGDQRVADVRFHDIGQRLIDLGELLLAAGKHTENRELRAFIHEAEIHGDEDVHQDVDRKMKAAVRRTLSGLHTFRRDYYDWERLVVEYALRNGFTQREVATLLGVGLSTVNRWAQHPLTYDD